MLRSEIIGTVKMRCYLSGMPELRLGLNDKVLFENTGRKYPLTLANSMLNYVLACKTFVYVDKSAPWE